MRSSILTTAAMLSLAVTAAAQVQGSFVTNGTGCVARSDALYELFPIGVFDLNNSAIEFIQNGIGNYILIPSAGTLVTPSGSETTVNGDDTVFTGIGLSFTFSYPGGSTNTIAVGANGHIAFQGDTATRCCTGTTAIAAALSGGPSIAGFNTDLNTAIGGLGANGRIWYEERSISGSQVFLATWENAGEYNSPGAANNFQIQLWDAPSAFGDRIVLVWGSTTPTVAHDLMVGWSSGGGQQDPGSRDFSNMPIDGGMGASIPLAMTGTTPREGQTMTWNLANVPASSLAGVIFVGVPAGGVPLDLIGMETCSLYANPFVTLPVALTAPTGTATLALGAGSAGLVLETQAAIIAPGETTLGVITSNGGTMTIGSPPQANDECSGAIVLPDGLTSGSTVGLTTSTPTGSCGAMGSDGWYLYVPSCTGTATVSFCTAGTARSYDTAIAAFSGTCGALTELACNDDFCGLGSQISFPVTIGVPVYVLIGGYSGGSGTFTVDVSCM